MIVFRPFKGEIITGSIKKCTTQGIQGLFTRLNYDLV